MAEANISTTKKCSKCKNVMVVDLFHRNKSKWDGLASNCKRCVKENNSNYYASNTGKVNAQNKEWRQKNIEKKSEQDKRWRLANKEKCNARNAAARAENPERNRAYQKKSWYKHYEKNLERKRIYRKQTPELQLVYVRSRQTRQKNAMPAWANIDNIKAIYRQCAWVTMVTGIKHHVDHYYPLKNDFVCGLHNEFNLRIIPAFDNLSKGNKLPE
jgi:hypothetical protein